MRRAAPALIATVGALGLLSTFHTTPAGRTSSAAAAPPPPTTTTPPPPSTSAVAPTTGRPTTTSTAELARTVTGPDVRTDYGDVQVRVVVQGGRILDVQPVTLPSDRARSQRISDVAGPMLRTEALRAQSADIDLISGATYTSEGYIQSLEGALDGARGR